MPLCKVCGIDKRVRKTEYRIKEQDGEERLLHVTLAACPNKRCSEYGKETEEVEILEYTRVQ